MNERQAMRFSINLRGDLAKLGDAELADRLQAAWATYDAADQRPNRFTLWYSRRGPIRHPWAYRLLSIAGLSGGGGMYLGLGPVIRFDAYGQHLTLCEIRDLTDEIERRLTQRKGAQT